MRRRLPPLILLLLAGCTAGGDGDSCRDVAHEYTYDVVGETGLVLVATTPYVSFISFEEMEAEYIDVEYCAANTNTPGPYVIFTDFDNEDWQRGLAFYYYAIQTAYINTNNYTGIQRTCVSDREFLRHEFMHHILYLNGEEPGHTNPKFAACDALGPKTCNGEYCED